MAHEDNYCTLRSIKYPPNYLTCHLYVVTYKLILINGYAYAFQGKAAPLILHSSPFLRHLEYIFLSSITW